MHTDPIVRPPPAVEFSTEVAERAEVHPPHELLGEDHVEALQRPSPSRMVRSPVDHRYALLLAVAAELSRDDAAAVVDVESLGLTAALERPPEVVGSLSGPFSTVGAGHHEVTRTIVQDGVDIGVPSHPGDAELVDVRLPEGVHVPPLEPLVGERFADVPDHEPVTLQDPMDRPPGQHDPTPT